MNKNIHIIVLSVLFSIILWISISLSYDYYDTVKVPVKLIDFPQGYTTGSTLPQKISIKLKGKGWKLVKVNMGTESDYIVSVGADSGMQYVNLYNYLVENQWLSTDVEVIDISPDTLSFFVERIIQKRLKVAPQLDLSYKSGYGLASPISVSPESTIVYGPGSLLKNMNTIPTEEVNLSGLDERTVKQVKLKSMQGMNYSNKSVSLQLDIQKIVDRNIDDLPVTINDMPRDRDVVLLPNRISLAVRGGIDILGKLSPDQFRAYVYYRDVVLDTLGSVVPHIVLPENTSLLYVKPERLRYIIKKFN